MEDNKEIAITAYINFQLLYDIEQELKQESNPKIKDIIAKTSTRLGAKPSLSQYYSPMNTGALFGLLYTTIVVPQESYGKEYFDNFEVTVSDYFDLSSEFKNIKNAQTIFGSSDFFRVIRNAIAHVNFSIQSNGSQIIIWNNDRHGNQNFKVITNLNRLTNFALQIAKYCNDKRNENGI